MTQEATSIVDTPQAQEAFATDIPTQTSTLVTPVAQPTNAALNMGKTYTEEDIHKVREQEKSKLYPQIDSLKEEVNVLKKEREERMAEAERLRAEKEEEARKKAEAEMDVRQLLENKEKEWKNQFEELKQEAARKEALLERERQFAEITEYRGKRLREESENILPELLDLITGNTPDEIESSIAGLRDRTSRILDSTQQAMQTARKEMKGTSITTPPSGPLDTNSDQQQFTAEQISAMSVTEYAKYRGKLLGQAASDRGKGIFG